MQNKKIKKSVKCRNILFWFAVGVFFVLCLIFFLTSTRQGLRLVTRQFLPKFIDAQDIQVGDVSGRLSEELVFERVELKDLKLFPDGTVIRVQRLSIKLKSLNPQDAQIDFENIRFFMPYSDPIVFSGHYRAGQLTANVYSRSVSVEECLSFLPTKITGNPKGTLKNIDWYLEGPLSAIKLTGTFEIEELILPRLMISEVLGELSMVLHRSETGFKPSGELRATQGKVKVQNTLLKLEESKLFFAGSFGQPTFSIKGRTSISNVDIDLSLLGTPQAPQLKLSSNPPLAQGALLLMFLTGKNMDVVQTSIEQQRLTPDLAKDMVDYFLLGGEGGRFAQKFGIKDVSIIYDKDVAGIGVKKEVTEYLDVGYQFEQQGLDRSQSFDLKHTLGAELKLNSRVSLEVDKEVYQFHNQERFTDTIKPDDRIFLKYKARF